MNICSVSIANDSAAPAATATDSRAPAGRRRGINATKKPNGMYERMLAARSKRVQRGGHGANMKNGLSGGGAIHGANGCRLA